MGKITSTGQLMSAPGLITYAVKEELQGFPAPVLQSSKFHFRCTGVGPANADSAIRTFLRDIQPAWVISTGFAGGLNPDYETGTLLADCDASFPFLDRLPLVRIRPGRFHLSPHILISRKEKEAVRHQTGGDAVEMESGVIRACCHEHGIPSATIRIILDPATEDLPIDFNTMMNEHYRLRYLRLAAELLRHPDKIGELKKFRAAVQSASRRLGQAFDLLLANQ